MVIGGLYFFFFFEFILHTWNAHTHHHDDSNSSSENENSKPFLFEDCDDMKVEKKREEKCTEPELTFPHGACKDSSKQSAKILHPGNSDRIENNSRGEPPSASKDDSKVLRACAYSKSEDKLTMYLFLTTRCHVIVHMKHISITF